MRAAPRSARLLVLALLLALVGAACGGSSGEDTASAAAQAEVADEGTETAAPEPLLVPTAAGGEIDLASYAGRPTLLWFWAPW